MSEQTQEDASRGDDVAAAFETVESSDPNPQSNEPAPSNPEPKQTELEGLPTGGVGGPPTGGEIPPETPPEVPVEYNAPQSWGVAEREAWNGLSPEVQAQIDKREKEIGEALSYSGDSRQFQDEFNSVVTPYAQLIAAENSTPMETVGTLLQTAASLMSGTPQTKAQTAANIIKQYGIDLHMLDSLLAGEMPQNNPNAEMESMLQQQLQPMQNWMQQQQNAQQQQYQTQYNQNQGEITTFLSSHEFANDVAGEMADILQMAAQRGQSKTLGEAYEQALLLRPDIQQVIEQRKAANAAQGSNQQIQQKRAAAVSVPGGAVVQGGEPAPQSMRDAITAAMENQR